MTYFKLLASGLILLLVWVVSWGQDGSRKQPDPLGPGDHTRILMLANTKRTYLVHVPKSYDPQKPVPLVLALHGAGMNGPMMVPFSGLNKTADSGGFVVVYPSGTGAGPFLTWNAGGFTGKMAEGKPDDVLFIKTLLDDLATVLKVDPARVYACGMSNGGMMCYRLAAELSDRIAAIAPVAGTIAIEDSKPQRPVPVMHFHGSKDTIVPFSIANGKTPPMMQLKGVEDSIQTWVKLNGCDATPRHEVLSKNTDDMKVTSTIYSGGKDGSEIVLVVVEGGGHTWPGQQPPVAFMGKSAMNISANDLLWEFFKKHSKSPQKPVVPPKTVFQVEGRPAFIIVPQKVDQKKPTPWVWYAPTFPNLPEAREDWMFQQFLAKGIAIAGIDVGESYGSPAGRKHFTALYKELVNNRGFASKAALLARSRGGLMLYNWASEHPESVVCIAGIYPVCDLRSYPGLDKACGAYGLTRMELEKQLDQHNPVARLSPLAKAGVPIFHIHGDVDKTVPLKENSGEVARQYEKLSGKMVLKIAQGQGHNLWEGFFQCQELVDFVIANSLSASKLSK